MSPCSASPNRSTGQTITALALAASLLLGGCGGGAPAGGAGGDWRGEVKELRMSIAALSQNGPGQSARLDKLKAYMERATSVPVKLYHVNDYNAVIQALSSGQVDFAMMAGGAYANVHEQIGKLAAPMLMMLGANGDTGYYSALVVGSDSPYRSLADLKGRSLGVVDRNSTSGYLMPMHALRAQGIDPDTYFSKIGLTGGHENSVVAVRNGQYDAAFVLAAGGTPETGFTMTAYSMMADRGMIPRDSLRPVWVAGPVPNESFVMRTDRPQALQDLVRGAMAALPYDEPDVITGMGGLPGITLVATDDSAFADVFSLRKEAIAAERGGHGSGRGSAQNGSAQGDKK